jgi:hypothetical protein
VKYEVIAACAAGAAAPSDNVAVVTVTMPIVRVRPE